MNLTIVVYPYISGVIQHVFFVFALSLSISSRFIHDEMCQNFFIRLYNIVLYISTTLCLFVDGYFGWFNLLAIVNTTAVNMGVQNSAFSSFVYTSEVKSLGVVLIF